MQSIRAELGGGIQYAAAPVSNARVQDWRAFLKGGHGAELRSVASDSQIGTVTGLSYDGNSGSLTAPSYDRRLFATLGTYAEVLDFATKFESANGAASATPIIDDTVGTGSPVAYAFRKSSKVDEAFISTAAPTKVASFQWGKVPTWRTGKLQFSLSLETDAFEGAIDLLEGLVAQRHSIAVGEYAVAAIVAALPASVQNVLSTDNSGVVSLQDCTRLVGALPKIYRKNAILLMSDTTHTALVQALEANARTLAGDPEEYLRKPIAICNTLPDFAPGAQHPIIAVDKRFLQMRTVQNGATIKRYTQDAATGVVYAMETFEGFLRCDFAPIAFDSQFPPVSVLNVRS